MMPTSDANHETLRTILPPGNCDAFKHRSYMAANGWRMALALAVKYGQRGAERTAREALAALGVDP